MEKIQISQFKALCLRLLDEVKRSGEPLMVTKNGEPLVVVYPAPMQRQRVPFGIAKDTGKIVGDIIEPASCEDTWEVLK